MQPAHTTVHAQPPVQPHVQPHVQVQGPPRDPPRSLGPGRWRATWIAGPAAGRSVRLDAGVHTVGRHERADVRTLDRALAPFHAQLDVAADGALRFAQLAGRSPCPRSPGWREDEPLVAATTGVWHVDIGASRLELRWEQDDANELRAVAQLSTGGEVSIVRRAPRALPIWRPDAIEVPTTATIAGVPAHGLVPAVLGIAGASIVAVVTGQTMFLVFGVIGGLVAVGGWGVQQLTAWRRRRRSRTGARSAMDAFSASLRSQQRDHATHHRAFVGSLDDAVADIDLLGPGLWARRADASDAFVVALGIGDVRWEPHLATSGIVPDACWTIVEHAATHRDAVIPAALGPGARLAICGGEGAAVLRSLIIQLSARVGPADWQLVIVSERARDREWAWAATLPHAVLPPEHEHHAAPTASPTAAFGDVEAAALCREPERLAGRHTVIVTDQWSALSLRTSALRRLVGADAQPALVVLCPTVLEAPAICTAVLDAPAGGAGRWFDDVSLGALPHPIRHAGLDASDATALAARLGRLVDPEDPRHAGGTLPRSASLVSLLSPDGVRPAADVVATWWRDAAPDAPPSAPIGIAADGIVDIDLVRDGPHALLAGTTGAGKSELLRSLVLGLAARWSPEHLTFVLVDYKGGATFDVCLPLPHVVGLVTDLDEHLAERALRSLRAELVRRERILRDAGATDLAGLRRATGAPTLPRLVVVIDEFAALAVEQPAFLHSLVGVAQRGRSLGVHLILATQRPSGVISDDIRANTNLRIALRVQDAVDSTDVIGDTAAATLPRDTPGRALMRLGPGDLVEFQTARVSAEGRAGASEAELLAGAVIEAAGLIGLRPPHRPWLEPLPSVIDPAAVNATDGAVGIVDLPDLQEQRPLRWDADAGHLLVVGARGAGVTSTLRTVAESRVRDGAQLYVIDALADRAWDDVAAHPRCGGVVRLHERERLMRVLLRLGRQFDDARPAVLVIDGLSALRAELDAVDRAAEAAAFARIIAGTGQARLAVLVGSADAVSVPASLLARCPQRWLLHVHDPHDASAVGLRAGRVPPDLPGRAIVVGWTGAGGPAAAAAASTGCDAQIVRPSRHGEFAAATTDAGRAAPVDVLPDVVTASELTPAVRNADEWTCPIGISFDTLATDVLTVPDGEHVLVLGPPRSGRSTVLVRMMRAWIDDAGRGPRAAREQPWVGVLAPRKSSLRAAVDATADVFVGVDELLDAVPPSGPALVLIDDAELVDDMGGRLASLIAARRPGLVVATAARPEALRAAYGHWTTAVRRSRRGVLMTGCHETDGDLLGAVLPRRTSISARAGLAFVVEDGSLRLVQCAIDPPPIVGDDAVLARARVNAGSTRRPRGLTAVS